MPEYEYSCSVSGNWDGVVNAKNKKEALIKAKRDIETEGLTVEGDIDLCRIK